MNQNFYVVDYIRRSLACDALEAPDMQRAGRWTECVTSIHTAHNMGGIEATRIAWSVICSQRPELAQMFSVLRNVYNATKLKDIPTLGYLLDQYAIYEASTNLLVGPRGGGKSYVCVDVACQLAANGHRVAYVAGEGANVYDSRVQAWFDHRNLPVSPNLFFYGEAVDTGDALKFNAFCNYFLNEIEPVLVVVDTVARCMVGMDENSSTDMKLFVARWEEVKQRGIGLLMVHHTNRGGRQRGSGVLDDAADSVLFLARNDDRISVYNDFMHGGKNRARREEKPKHFVLKTHEVGEYVGEDAAAVLVPGDFKKIDLSKDDVTLTSNEQSIVDTLEGIDEGYTGAELQKILTALSTSSLYYSLNQLEKKGVITKQAGFYTLAHSNNSNDSNTV